MRKSGQGKGDAARPPLHGPAASQPTPRPHRGPPPWDPRHTVAPAAPITGTVPTGKAAVSSRLVSEPTEQSDPGYMALADGTRIPVRAVIDPQRDPAGRIVVWLQPVRPLLAAERDQLDVAHIQVNLPLAPGVTHEQVTVRFGSPADWFAGAGGMPEIKVTTDEPGVQITGMRLVEGQ